MPYAPYKNSWIPDGASFASLPGMTVELAVTTLSPYDKSKKTALRSLPTDFDFVDARAGRALAAPVDQRLDGGTRPFGDRLHGTIVAIRDPAG